MAEFNGLPSVVGLDGSLSDVGARKKYPFELEKAIHNVMFIQHHMQRQDEFDAVSMLGHCVSKQSTQHAKEGVFHTQNAY
jgi:nicotinic acetylcholine receptor